MQHQLWKWAQNNPSVLKQCQEQWKIEAGKNEKLTVEVLSRLLTATAIQPQVLDFDSTLDWIETATKFLQNVEQRNRLETVAREVRAWPSTLSAETQSAGAVRAKVDFDQRPRLAIAVRAMGQQQRLDSSHQTSGGSATGLPALPSCHV